MLAHLKMQILLGTLRSFESNLSTRLMNPQHFPMPQVKGSEVVFADGHRAEFDHILLATGYCNLSKQQMTITRGSDAFCRLG